MRNLFYYYSFLFLLGGQGYCTLEILWRGRTHYSMFFAGGLIFIFLVFIQREAEKAPLLLKCLLGSIFITATEFIFGCVFNLEYSMGVWDYSNQPFNILGQICLLYSVLWFFLCFILFKWVIKDKLYNRLV